MGSLDSGPYFHRGDVLAQVGRHQVGVVQVGQGCAGMSGAGPDFIPGEASHGLCCGEGLVKRQSPETTQALLPVNNPVSFSLPPKRQEGLNPVTLPIAPHRYRSYLVRSEQGRALLLIAAHHFWRWKAKAVSIAERSDRHLR